MKKKLLFFVGLMMAAQLGFSGGLVLNNNQSTAWSRMMIRNASTDIDAIFFNPAGLAKMNDGFHFSVNNQSIWQTQKITSTFPYLNDGNYEGSISAPIFPTIYGAWKKNKFSVSVAFMPIGGGGGAEFTKGLPMMEVPFSSMVPALSPLGVTGYNMNMSFQGTSVYYGVQAGLTYEINDYLSVFAGARYVWAVNTYEGSISDMNVTTPAGDLPPGDYVQGVSDQAAGGAAQANGAADGMQPIIDGGGGDFTLAQLEGAGIIDAATRAQLEGGLLAVGVPQEQIDAMNAAQVQGSYYYAGTELSATSQMLAGQAAYLSVITADQEADITQKGSGITPILGANISLLDDKLNFGIKYEFKTNMELTNEVADNKGFLMGMDPVTGEKEYMFVDGDKVNADIPANFNIGVQYQILKNLRAQAAFMTYFDKDAGWATAEDGTELIDKNFIEYGLGLEFDITEKFLVSAGVVMARTGVNQAYQSDLDYSLSTNTFGGGFAYHINKMFTAQIGGYYVVYMDETYNDTYTVGETAIPYTTNYDKETFGISIGLDIHL